MSWPWKPTPYGPRGRDLQWLNATFGIHDLYCGCDNPPEHLLLSLLNHSGKLGLQKQHIQNAQKCLGYGEETKDTTDGGHTEHTTITHDEDVIEPGDLEELFAEDTEPTG